MHTPQKIFSLCYIRTQSKRFPLSPKLDTFFTIALKSVRNHLLKTSLLFLLFLIYLILLRISFYHFILLWSFLSFIFLSFIIFPNLSFINLLSKSETLLQTPIHPIDKLFHVRSNSRQINSISHQHPIWPKNIWRKNSHRYRPRLWHFLSKSK